MAKDGFVVGPIPGREAPYMAVEIPRSGIDLDCEAIQEGDRRAYGFNALDTLSPALAFQSGVDGRSRNETPFMSSCAPSVDELAEKITSISQQTGLHRLVIVHHLSSHDYGSLHGKLRGNFTHIRTMPNEVAVRYPADRPIEPWGYFEGEDASWRAEGRLIQSAVRLLNNSVGWPIDIATGQPRGCGPQCGLHR
jgi:hypothetical protein